MSIEESLSYDDVLLLPGYCDFPPAQTDVRTVIAGDIRANIPILSAAMDTVTEDQLAIALALEGGVGVIHRNLSPEDQAAHVARVKRFLNWVIDDPLTIEKNRRVAEVAEIMNRYGISGLPVLDEGRLVGIVTSRDLRFCKDYSRLVADIMTKQPIVETGNPDITSAQQKFDTHKIEKLPVVDSTGKLTGLITVKDMEKHRNFPNAALDASGRLLVGAAVGPTDVARRSAVLVNSRPDFLVIDAAHGDTKAVVDALRYLKSTYPLPVIAGNIATGDAAGRLIDAGADALKVGVGPGSICTTRIVAGIGVPQFSAIQRVAEVAGPANVPVIADGGIKYSGDVVKAIAAGADSVMVGNLFAGLKESPGREVIFEGRIFKTYRGMGSIAAVKQGAGDRYQMAEGEDVVPEGVEGRVPYKGELKPFLHQLVTGLKKGMGYTGCRNLHELRNYRKFVKVSAAGLRESHVHDVSITQEPPNYSR